MFDVDLLSLVPPRRTISPRKPLVAQKTDREASEHQQGGQQQVVADLPVVEGGSRHLAHHSYARNADPRHEGPAVRPRGIAFRSLRSEGFTLILVHTSG